MFKKTGRKADGVRVYLRGRKAMSAKHFSERPEQDLGKGEDGRLHAHKVEHADLAVPQAEVPGVHALGRTAAGDHFRQTAGPGLEAEPHHVGGKWLLLTTGAPGLPERGAAHSDERRGPGQSAGDALLPDREGVPGAGLRPHVQGRARPRPEKGLQDGRTAVRALPRKCWSDCRWRCRSGRTRTPGCT